MDKSLDIGSLNQSVQVLNTSTSKQKYSFSKSPRFTQIEVNSSARNGSFYDLPSIKNTRSTSFGFGNKDFGMRF